MTRAKLALLLAVVVLAVLLLGCGGDWGDMDRNSGPAWASPTPTFPATPVLPTSTPFVRIPRK